MSLFVLAACDEGAVMGDGCAGGAESAARGAALERAYVHDVYEQAGEDDEAPLAPAPAVRAFLADLEPGSLICDVGQYFLYQVFVYLAGLGFLSGGVKYSKRVPTAKSLKTVVSSRVLSDRACFT